MIFDRIFEDALNFIRRFLGWQNNKNRKTEKKPFQSMRSHLGDWGVVSLVIGRDTPRAVRSWIYSPKRQSYREAFNAAAAPPSDLHFYLDFLGPLPNVNTPMAAREREERQAQRKQGKAVATHRLHILKAGHFLNTEGFYDCELMFWGDYDFAIAGPLDSQRVAVMVLDKLVISCLRIAEPLELTEEQWKQKVEDVLQAIKTGGISESEYRRSKSSKRR